MKLQKYRFIKDFGIYSKDNVVEINKEEAKMLKDYVVKVIPYEEQKEKLLNGVIEILDLVKEKLIDGNYKEITEMLISIKSEEDDEKEYFGLDFKKAINDADLDYERYYSNGYDWLEVIFNLITLEKEILDI